jgi:hypothetical protein
VGTVAGQRQSRWLGSVSAGEAAAWACIVCVCGPGMCCTVDKVAYLRRLKWAVVVKVLSTWAAHGPS